jgi:ABC-type multidrug transport system ATPase subunit
MKHKPIRQFSSGMKQRVKLVLAILSDVPMILLDEPTMNLDKAGIEWYLELIKKFAGNRTIMICSNLHQTESAFAAGSLQIEDYK